MKRQFKVVSERNIEFSILKKRAPLMHNLRDDEQKRIIWEVDLYLTNRQISEKAKFLPSVSGLLVITSKNDEILKVIFSQENVRTRFLLLRAEADFEVLIKLMRSKSLRTIKIYYAREIRV